MRTLQLSSRGQDVQTLQRLLYRAGLGVIQDGIFGRITQEAVMAFQKENKLTPDGIVGPKTWELLLSLSDELVMSRRNIKQIIVHCTDTKEGKNYTLADITKWHKEKGYNTSGYHYVIDINGKIMNGRDVNVIGAHCKGYNSYSIGVCYIGGRGSDNVTKDTRTKEQKDSLLNLLKRLKILYPQAKIYGHRNFANRMCPCFDAAEEYKNI